MENSESNILKNEKETWEKPVLIVLSASTETRKSMTGNDGSTSDGDPLGS